MYHVRIRCFSAHIEHTNISVAFEFELCFQIELHQQLQGSSFHVFTTFMPVCVFSYAWTWVRVVVNDHFDPRETQRCGMHDQ